MDINFKELLKVKPKKEKPTFLNIIGCDYREVYISSLIGYALLNDDELAKNLLELYFKKFPQKLKSNDYLNFDLSQIDIELEKSMDGRRADVFVKINNIDNPNIPISTITIENKTDTSEHGNQTLDYYNWINNEYKETNNAFFYLYPNYNPSTSISNDFFDIDYSTFNNLITGSNDYIIRDLKTHIKQRMINYSMNINNEEKEIIEHYKDYFDALNDLSIKIKEKKNEIVKDFVSSLNKNGYIVIADDEKVLNNELIIENVKNKNLGTTSFRLYKYSWYSKNNFYLYLEIKFFDNTSSPFELITFQQTIKSYERKSQDIIKEFYYNYCKNKYYNDKSPYCETFNKYYVLNKLPFKNNKSFSWNTKEWDECLVSEATDYFIEHIEQCDKIASQLREKFEI
jgi:hypothetical protein